LERHWHSRGLLDREHRIGFPAGSKTLPSTPEPPDRSTGFLRLLNAMNETVLIAAPRLPMLTLRGVHESGIRAVPEAPLHTPRPQSQVAKAVRQ